MRHERHQLTTTHIHAGARLDHVVAQWIGRVLDVDVSKRRAKQLIDQGAVRIDRRTATRASQRLAATHDLEASLPSAWLDALRRPAEPLWALSASDILYEDDDLIAFDKPPGLPSQASVANREQHLFAAAQRFLRARDGADAYVGLHHRLDKDTSGVLLMTRARRANKGIAALFRERRVKKTYRALTIPSTSHPTGERWQMKGPLRRPGPQGEGDDGRWAVSECVVLASSDLGAEVDVQPGTGRRHQVRLHLSMSSIPILGDARYGAPTPTTPHRIMLHAHALSFLHPIGAHPIEIVSPLPDDFLTMRSGLSLEPSVLKKHRDA